MTSKLQVDNLEGRTTKGSITVTGESNGASTNLQQGLLKCWVKFDGEGTVAINDSFNVTTLNDNGTGDYDIQITNPFANEHYAAVTDNESHSGHLSMLYGEGATNGRYATDQFRTYIVETSGGVTDSNIVTNLLAGDLA